MPPIEDITRLDDDAIFKLAEEEALVRAYIQSDPAKFFVPNPGGQEQFMTYRSPPSGKDEIDGLFFFAGNKSGKTTACCMNLAEMMLGRPLWGGAGRRGAPYIDKMGGWISILGPGRTPPLKASYYTEDFNSHSETILPTYLTWCPRDEIAGISFSSAGNPEILTHKNKSQIFFHTYEQGDVKAEGKDSDLYVYDEPPPRDLYIATRRGLVTTNGKVMIGATLLKEPWLWDELGQPFIKGFEASIHENRWLDANAKERFLASLSDTERLSRELGKPSHLVGLIYPELKDQYPYVIPYEETPWGIEQQWPVIMAVDPHERKPLHIVWGWVTPSDNIIWFDWMLVQNTSIFDVFQTLKSREITHRGLRDGKSLLTIMDPNRGPARQLGGRSWEEEFRAHGYSVVLGDDDLDIGHSTLKNDIHFGKQTWMDTCRGDGGPLYQMLRYTWDDWRGRDRSTKAAKEKPRDQFKDFPDCFRYVSMSFISFDGIKHMNQVIKLRKVRPGVRAYA